VREHVSTRDDARGGNHRAGQKKWPLRGAAKFREETPRKGGGFAIEDRNTALQQYADKKPCLQAQSIKNFPVFSAKNMEISAYFSSPLALSEAFVQRSKTLVPHWR